MKIIRYQFFSTALLLFISSVFFSNSANASDYLYLIGTKVVHTKNAGNIKPISLSFSKYDFISPYAGVEIQNYRHETIVSGKLTMPLGGSIVEVSVNKYGPHFRLGLQYQLFNFKGPYAPVLVFLNLGYEKDKSDFDFSGPYLGIDIFFLK